MFMQLSALCLNGPFGYEPGWRGWGTELLGSGALGATGSGTPGGGDTDVCSQADVHPAALCGALETHNKGRQARNGGLLPGAVGGPELRGSSQAGGQVGST